MSRPSLIDRLRRMNQRSLFGPGARSFMTAPHDGSEAEEISSAGQARAEALQRLQVGVSGIGAMVLLVGLASIIGGQAEMNDDQAVPEAAPTTEPEAKPAQANPLADAGVVPDIADEPSDVSTPPLPIAPGNAAPAQ
jgi:hypothetical protein